MFDAVQSRLQVLGRALMLPIAVLPVAGIMLRFGQSDMLAMPFIAAAGAAVFSHLGLLFAIGVAVSMAKENNGAAGLASAVAYLVLTEGAKVLIQPPADIIHSAALDPAARDAVISVWKDQQLGKLGVPAGIICGLAAGTLYNRFHTIKLPEYLAFFGGRRFVPIAAGLFGVLVAPVFGLGFPAIEAGVDRLSQWVIGAGPVGLFLYGLLNRLLIVTGLHHILNNIAWFVLGNYHGVSGDLNRFFAGDKSAGAFMAGFFPVMMFGLPGACAAMFHAARPEQRRVVGGMLLSMALTSLLTGVTEPIEFTFMFIAPVLYALHAVLTGVSMVVMDLLGVKLGFGFSAGLIDFLLNYRLATRAWLLLPVGATYFLIYYGAFSFVIRRFDLPTPGRDRAELEPTGHSEAQGGDIGTAYTSALGGPDNLEQVEACTTRLRLTLRDRDLADEKRLMSLGAKGLLPVGQRNLQVIIGPDADRIAGAIRAATKAGVATSPVPSVAVTRTAPANLADLDALNQLLGGAGNVLSARRIQSRLIVSVVQRALVDFEALARQHADHWFETRAGKLHILMS